MSEQGEHSKKYPLLSKIELEPLDIRINPHLTQSYVPISTTALTLSRTTSDLANVMQHVNKVSLPISMVADTIRIGSAIYKDYQQGKVKKSIKTGASIAGAWAGGYLGGSAGITSGGALGATVGSLIGGVGAAPGAAVGSILGGLVGSIGGSLAGSLTAEKLASNPNSDGKYNDLIIIDQMDFYEENEETENFIFEEDEKEEEI